MPKTFPKRLYPSLGSFLTDLRYILRHRDDMKTLMGGAVIGPQFRERLMLAVTQVNGCRYCSYFHTRQALAAGISDAELAEIAACCWESSPPEERPALFYAQHWAESGASPDPAAAERILQTYGAEHTRLIELALRTIRVGNLTGNFFDYLLFRLSFGRWGLDQPAALEESHAPH